VKTPNGRLILLKRRESAGAYPDLNLRRHSPDVRLPGLSASSLPGLRHQGMEAPVLTVERTARPGLINSCRGARAGAARLLTKPCLAELPSRACVLCPAGPAQRQCQAHYAALELDRIAAGLTRCTMAFPLTSRNSPLLEFFLLHAPDL